jgi:hypothetical protein
MNWDLLSQNNPKAIVEAISSGKPVLTEAYMLPNMSDSEQVAEFDAWTEWFRNFIHPGDVSLNTHDRNIVSDSDPNCQALSLWLKQDPSEPATDLQYPIIDRTLNSIEVNDNNTEIKSQSGDFKVVGTVVRQDMKMVPKLLKSWR